MVRTGSKATALLLGRRRLCSSAVEQAAGSRRTELDFGTGSVELVSSPDSGRDHASRSELPCIEHIPRDKFCSSW